LDAALAEPISWLSQGFLEAGGSTNMMSIKEGEFRSLADNLSLDELVLKNNFFLKRPPTGARLLIPAVSEELQEPEYVLVPYNTPRPIAIHSGQTPLLYDPNEFDGFFAKPEASAGDVNSSSVAPIVSRPAPWYL
jgi:hypothetical protein